MQEDPTRSSARLRKAEDLARLPIDAAEQSRNQQAAQAYNVRAPEHYLRLIDWDDPRDPVRLQTIPQAEELHWDPREREDPIGDKAHSPVPRLTHRYPDRVLLYPTYQCAVYCRHCFRKESLGDDAGLFSAEQLEPALGYIAAHPEVREVILTGGDPLVLSNGRLAQLRARIEAIPHIRLLRLHTRVPVVLPARVTSELVDALKGRLMVSVVTHFNHPREITPETIAAARLLREAGFMLLNQTVLLRGINDDAATLQELFRELVYSLGIKPYYLHHCDQTQGLTHFRTTIDQGLDLMKQLRGHISGLCLPLYVLDIPGGYGKVPLGPGYAQDRHGHDWVFHNYQGIPVKYTEIVPENPPPRERDFGHTPPAMRHFTKDLPGTGGQFKATPEDFLVEEVSAYLPCGSGEHTFLWIEKRALTTQDAVKALCRHLGVREGEVGVAGQKDRQAVTRQWLSLPRVDPEPLLGLALEAGGGSVTVLQAARHKNKLRTGHLRGNRFTLTVRDTEDGVQRARAILAALHRLGLPNRYGAQRFGHKGQNVEQGQKLIRGELRVNDRFKRRFLISAYQSALFNRYLDRRQEAGLLLTVLAGDILQKRESGGLFFIGEAEVAATQQRLDAGEVAVTGPIFGSKMQAPAPGTEPARREAEVLAEEGVTQEELLAIGPLAEGTRRPLVVPIELFGDLVGDGVDQAVTAHPDDPRAIVLRFALPPGSYATLVLDEIIKPQDPLQLSI